MTQAQDTSAMVGILPFDQEKYGFKGMQYVPYGQMDHSKYGLVDLIRIVLPNVSECYINLYLKSPSGVTSTFLHNGANQHTDGEWGIKLTRYDRTGERTFAIFTRQKKAAEHHRPIGAPVYRMCLVTFDSEDGRTSYKWWGYSTGVANDRIDKPFGRVVRVLSARAEQIFPKLESTGWDDDLGGSNVGKYKHRHVIVDFGFDAGDANPYDGDLALDDE